MKVYYSDFYTFDLPEGHRFPASKYSLLREQLLTQEILSPDELYRSPLATRALVTLAHTPEYYDAIYTGSIDSKIMRQIGLPWSFDLVQRSLASVGGTLCAANDALERGLSGNLAGGTHHAMADAGQGFCVFNDIAVTILKLLEEGRIQRAAVIDLDVHQGNGDASILGAHPEVFTFSIHGQKNFPFRKVASTLDVGLPDNAGDFEYIHALERTLPDVFAFEPDFIIYQAGVDPLKEDRLGRLSLTLAGLEDRDRLVLSKCKDKHIPVCLTLGGGYARPIELTVDAHLQTYRVAKEVFELRGKEK